METYRFMSEDVGLTFSGHDLARVFWLRLTVPEVLPLAKAVYARDSAGCCAHVVLDDGNSRTVFVEGCLSDAIARGHADCVALCRALLCCSQTQRRKIARSMVR